MELYKNTKKQGDAGLGAAIGYFTRKGLGVSIPLTDSQDYDLITDDNGKLGRVQVKTSTFIAKKGQRKSQNYYVSLTVKGGNRSGVGEIKKFNPEQVDAVFILTPTSQYCIPVSEISGKNSITLGEKYEKFKV